MEPAATRTSTTGTRRGFTAIELMVVLVIIVIMSGTVMVSMGPVLAEARLRSGCRTVASALNYARSYAVTHQTYTRVFLDKEKNGVSVQAYVQDENGEGTLEPLTTPSGRYHSLPRTIKVDSVEKPGVDEEEDYVSFSQLGQADDAVILLVDPNNGKSKTITVDAVTGRAAIVDSESQ